ncbi:hypothetical protein DV702_04250 [Sporosarcina sp. PTS2304]|uniref:YqgU-like beta propeller domain-containing protein n=1 Tax=Sporosarcina sp. PTS2304 TaxID=2283194 RepID=UPI000E0DFA69|nr:hypothetical protein [Sporosarcina sp. PTS2304]AXH99012.1 hypothetical protein DV702_04250 [Sporosarcina sp. PTS2304]
MKRIIWLPILAIALLGCQQQAIEEPQPHMEEEEMIQTLNIPEDEFRFVAGWFDEQTIGFVVHQENENHVQAFNIVTGEIKTLYTDSAIISDVLIHRSSQEFLVKTSNNSTEAIIILFTKNAEIIDELVIESSELEINWNPADTSKLLLSAFAEDWSYETYMYDSKKQEITQLALSDPFPKWLGEDAIVYKEDSTIVKELLVTNDKILLASDVTQFFASSTQLLLEQPEGETKRYKVLDAEGKELYTWVLGNPAQAAVHAEMLDDEMIVMSTADQTSSMPTIFLHQLHSGDEVEKYEIEGELMSCNSTDRCLTGNRLETMIQLETGEKMEWLVSK